jgi:hypothetical protein
MNHESRNKFVSFLKKNSGLGIGVIAVIFIAFVMFLIGRNIGNSSSNAIRRDFDKLSDSNQALREGYNTLQKQYSALSADYQNTANELKQLTDKYSVNQSIAKQIVYKQYGWFSTSNVVSLNVRLGKNDRFEGLFRILTRVIIGPVPEKDWKWEDGGEVIFTVEGNNKKIINAGRVQNEYSFTFVAEESGDYKLIFVDPTYRLHIDLFYNSPTIIQNLDINN